MDRNQLAEVLRVERARLNYTVRMAAQLAGVSSSVVSELENGRRDARYDSVRRILALYGKDLTVGQSE